MIDVNYRATSGSNVEVPILALLLDNGEVVDDVLSEVVRRPAGDDAVEELSGGEREISPVEAGENFPSGENLNSEKTSSSQQNVEENKV